MPQTEPKKQSQKEESLASATNLNDAVAFMREQYEKMNDRLSSQERRLEEKSSALEALKAEKKFLEQAILQKEKMAALSSREESFDHEMEELNKEILALRDRLASE